MVTMRFAVYRITEMKDDCLFREEMIREIDLPVMVRSAKKEREIAEMYGGHRIQPTSDDLNIS